MPKYNDLASCHFFQPQSNDLSLSCFVYEPYPFDCETEETRSSYSLVYITEGEGSFSSCGYTYPVKKNDFITIFPDTPFRYAGIKNFAFSYLRFSGKEGEKIILSMGGDKHSPVLRSEHDFTEQWLSAFHRSQKKDAPWAAKALLYSVAEKLCVTDSTNHLNEKPKETLGQAVNRYIASHYTDSDLSLKKLSALFHFSYEYLSQVLYKENGLSFLKYVIELRMNRACALLTGTSLSVKEIAESVGYPDQLYFSRIFKNRFEMTPSEYRVKKKRRRDPLYDDFYVLK